MNPLQTPWQRKNLNLNAHHPGVQRLASAIEKLCCRWYIRSGNEQRKLVIVGNPGCGKTTSLRAVREWASRCSFGVYKEGIWPKIPNSAYHYWPDCVACLEKGATSFLDDLKSATLLLLDDIGSEADPWKKHAVSLCSLLEARDRAALWSIVTTNLPSDQWIQFYGERIADRLLRHSIVCDVSDIPSYATK